MVRSPHGRHFGHPRCERGGRDCGPGRGRHHLHSRISRCNSLLFAVHRASSLDEFFNASAAESLAAHGRSTGHCTRSNPVLRKALPSRKAASGSKRYRRAAAPICGSGVGGPCPLPWQGRVAHDVSGARASPGRIVAECLHQLRLRRRRGTDAERHRPCNQGPRHPYPGLPLRGGRARPSCGITPRIRPGHR